MGNNTLKSILPSSSIPSIGMVLIDILVFLFNIAILVILFKKKQSGPKWIITFIWAGFVVGLIKLVFFVIPSTVKSLSSVASGLGLSGGSLIFTAIVSAAFGFFIGLAYNIIVTVYFVKSKRVKNTFVK